MGWVGTEIKGGTCQLRCQSVNRAATAMGTESLITLVTKCVAFVFGGVIWVNLFFRMSCANCCLQQNRNNYRSRLKGGTVLLSNSHVEMSSKPEFLTFQLSPVQVQRYKIFICSKETQENTLEVSRSLALAVCFVPKWVTPPPLPLLPPFPLLSLSVSMRWPISAMHSRSLL